MTDTAKRGFPWGRVILFGSLAVNLMVAGLVIGAVLRGHDGGDRHHKRDHNPVLRQLGFGPFVQALPDAGKQALTQSILREAGSFRENRKKLREKFEAILTTLRADPYDPSELERLLTEQRQRLTERQALGQSLLLEQLAGMSAAERLSYADALDKALRRGPRPSKPRSDKP